MEPKISYTLGEPLIAGVISAAVISEQRRPGLWQDMLRALDRGAAKTSEGTVNAVLVRAMLDRLLEEFHAGEQKNRDCPF